MDKKIICIGGANIDFKLKSQNQYLLNTSNPVSTSSSYGGVARNVAHNLANVTSNIYLQCVVGDDAHGRDMLKYMESLGVNTEHSLILEGRRTSQYHAILNEHGELFLGLADMEIYNEISREFITTSWDFWNKQSLVFLDTNLPSVLIDLILEKAALMEFLVCIDLVSVEKAKKIPQCLDSVFLLKSDAQEASVLTGIPIHSVSDCMKAGFLIKERGVKNSVISLGSLGYVLINDNVQIHVPAEEVENVIDVSGAGDAFIAGILYGLQQGKEVFDACQMGAKAAVRTIQSMSTVV